MRRLCSRPPAGPPLHPPRLAPQWKPSPPRPDPVAFLFGRALVLEAPHQVEPAAPTPAAQEHYAPLLQEHGLLFYLHEHRPQRLLEHRVVESFGDLGRQGGPRAPGTSIPGFWFCHLGRTSSLALMKGRPSSRSATALPSMRLGSLSASRRRCTVSGHFAMLMDLRHSLNTLLRNVVGEAHGPV